MSDDMRIHYEAVIRDLDTKCADVQQRVGDLQRQLKDLHFTRANICRMIDVPGTAGHNVVSVRSHDTQKYATYSVRWAILFLLSESSDPLSIQEISDALLAGVIRTSATNFSNNVSAVLSQMKSKLKPEVEAVESKWKITEIGRGAWNHIWNKQAKQARFKRLPSFGMETPDAMTPSAILTDLEVQQIVTRANRHRSHWVAWSAYVRQKPASTLCPQPENACKAKREPLSSTPLIWVWILVPAVSAVFRRSF
jgi:hypothetical protein